MWICCDVKCDVMQYHEVLWNVVMRCGIMVWYMWNMVVCCDARCEIWCRTIPHHSVFHNHIRHGSVMWNDGWNVAWDVWCHLECVLLDSAMCNLYLKCGDVHGVVWGGMWARCGMACREMVAEWFDVNYGAMWNVVWNCGLLCEIWCNVECCYFRHGVIEMCVVEYMVWCGMWCPGMWNVA